MTAHTAELHKAGSPATLRAPLPPRVAAIEQGALTLELHRGTAGLAALRGDWDQLVATIPVPHCGHYPEWHESRLQSLAPDEQQELFVLARRGGVPVAVCPLRWSRRGAARAGLRVLEIPWHAHTLYTDFVFDRSEANRALLPWILDHLGSQTGLRWDILRCELFADDSCLEFGLANIPAWRVMREAGPNCDVLPCRAFDELKEDVSKNFRGNLRKAQNKLEKLADVRMTTARTSAELSAALDKFLAIEASGWKGTAGTGSAIRLDARLVAFYRSLFERFGRRHAAEIHLLHGDGACLAGDLCLSAGRTTFMLKVGYDEAYAAVAPGNMLLGRVLDQYARTGEISDINLMTDAAWHQNWKPQPRRTASAWVFNTTLRGRAAQLALAWRQKRRDARLARAAIIEPSAPQAAARLEDKELDL